MKNTTNSGIHENEFIQTFFRQNSSVMMLIDPGTGKILEANSAAFRFYGYNDLLSMNVKSINLLGNDKIAELMQLGLSGEKKHFEFKHLLAGGDIRDVEVYSTPFEINGKKVLFSIVHDITKRKEAVRNSSIVSQAVLDLFQFSTPGEVYSYAIDKLYELVGQKAIVAIVEFNNPGNNNWKMIELRGVSKIINGILKKFGVDIHQMTGDVRTSFFSVLKNGKLTSLPFDLHTLTNGKYSKNTANALKKFLPIGNLLVMPFIKEDTIYGTVTIAPTSKSQKLNIPLIEAFISQITIFLEKIFAEKELKESERKLLAAEKIAHVGNYEIDVKTGHAKWSEETFHIFGMNPQTDREPTTNEYSQLVHPKDKEKVDNLYNNCIKNGHDFNLTYRIIRKDDTVRYVESIGEIVKNVSGEAIKMFGTFQDITEAKTAENKIVQSEKKYRAIFENSHDLISIHPITENGFQGFPEVNSQVVRTMGFTKEEFKKLKIFDIVPKEEHPKMQKAIDEIFKHGKYSLETFHTTKSGKTIPVEITGYISEVESEKFLTVVTRSLEEQKKAEQAIIESKNYFQALIEKSTDIISILDKNGFLKYKSPSHAKVLGYGEEELIGVNYFELIHPEDCEPFQKQISKLLKKQGGIEKLNFRYKRKNGSWRFMEGTANNLLDIQSIEGIVLNYRDVTERMKSEEELVKAKEKAEENERLKSAFLANMSHEIRTPMNGIVGFLDILQDPDITDNDRAGYIKLVKQSGNRLMNTINDIIEISKIEANQLSLNYSHQNVKKLLQEHFNFFAPETKEKGLGFRFSAEISEDLTILTDKSKLDSILTNLIKNAIKFTSEGEIIIECKTRKNQLEIVVKDTGKGIPKEKIETIFNRFEQGDASFSRGYEGSGLGLSISLEYAKMLGGEIRVESEEGKGSIFCFIIDYQEQTAKSDVKEQPKPKSINPGDNKLILVAEDDETSFKLVEILLKKENYKVIQAENGLEAVEMCKKNPDIDMVLMDLKMPVLDGYEATRKIREFNSELPIVAQTAYALAGDEQKALEAGCNEYVVKPILKADLFSKIQKLLK